MPHSSPSSENPYASPQREAVVTAHGLNVAPSGLLSLDYELTLDDLVEFSVAHHLKSRHQRQQRGCVTTIVVGAALLVAVIWIRASDFGAARAANAPIVAAIFVMSIVVGMLLYSLVFRQRTNLRRVVQRMYGEGHNDAILGWHRVSLSTAELRVEGANVTTSLRLTALCGVFRAPTLLCFYYSAVNAIVIPLRAFASEAEIERFVDMATGVKNLAKGQAVPCATLGDLGASRNAQSTTTQIEDERK